MHDPPATPTLSCVIVEDCILAFASRSAANCWMRLRYSEVSESGKYDEMVNISTKGGQLTGKQRYKHITTSMKSLIYPVNCVYSGRRSNVWSTS